MGDLIEFPLHRRRPNVEVEIVGQMDNCEGSIHVFAEVPGRCQCGANEWTPDHTLEPDGIGLHVFDPPPAS